MKRRGLGRRLLGWMRGDTGDVLGAEHPAELPAADMLADGERLDVEERMGAGVDPAMRWPPLAHDPAVASRTPESWLMGYPGAPTTGDAERLALRYYGQDTSQHPPAERLAEAAETVRQINAATRPGDQPTALRWTEGELGTVGGEIDTGAPATLGLAWEVERVTYPKRSLAVLEQLAVWYRAVPLDAQGDPAGDAFIATLSAQGGDLLAQPVHPADGGRLVVTWRLLRQGGAVATPPDRPVQAHHIPAVASDLGVPPAWDDGRFWWDVPNGHTLRCVCRGDGGSTLRLYAVPTVVGAGRWRVDYLGRLAGWSQLGAVDGAALAAAVRRE